MRDSCPSTYPAAYSGQCRTLKSMPANIHGQERSVEKVFSDDYAFSIPLYQRPYSWTEENVRELLVDLLTAMPAAGQEGTVDPYFLGCIVLIKGDGPDAEVIDGQQRLTTLTILLAALRQTMTTKATADHITQYIYAPGNPLTGRPDRFRLTLREQDAEFFQSSIQKESGIESLVQTKNTLLPDSRLRLRSNTLLLLTELTNRTEDERQRLARFVINNCFIVVVSTPSFDSAYRIFSILNDRGLNLSASDILKADLIGLLIPAERGKYGREWEDLEETLGTERFNQLFVHVRMIYRRTKLKNVLAEFRDQIIKKEIPVADAAQRGAAAKNFLVQKLFPYGRAFRTVATASYESTSGPDRLNELFRWLMQVDNADWLAPAISYYHKHEHDQPALERYFTDLERLAASFLIRRTNVNQRIERYSRLLGAIEDGDDLYISTSPLQLDTTDAKEVLAALDEDVYNANARARAYILLGLDRELALLTRNKNSEASNYEFDKKQDTHFTGKKGVTNYALTVSILAQQGDWTPSVVEDRQKKFLAAFTKLWRLD